MLISEGGSELLALSAADQGATEAIFFLFYLRAVYTVAKALPLFHGRNKSASSLPIAALAAISGGAAARRPNAASLLIYKAAAR